MLEKQIVTQIMVALRKEGAWAIKTHGSPMLAGMPDILVCYRGRFVALEVKRPETRDTVTDRQLAFLRQIGEAGGKSAVVTSVAEALEVLGQVELLALAP